MKVNCASKGKQLAMEPGLGLRTMIEPLVQTVIPDFYPPPDPEDVRYFCACGRDIFFIRQEHIECAFCHTRYEDGAMPPEEFNASRDNLVVSRRLMEPKKGYVTFEEVVPA